MKIFEGQNSVILKNYEQTAAELLENFGFSFLTALKYTYQGTLGKQFAQMSNFCGYGG